MKQKEASQEQLSNEKPIITSITTELTGKSNSYLSNRRRLLIFSILPFNFREYAHGVIAIPQKHFLINIHGKRSYNNEINIKYIQETEKSYSHASKLC